MTDNEIKIKVCLELIDLEIDRLAKIKESDLVNYINDHLLLKSTNDYDVIKMQYIIDTVNLERFKRIH